MITCYSRWIPLLFMAGFAAAQNPPARPSKPDDAAALEEAIRAVDRAAEKASTAKPGQPTPPGKRPAAEPQAPDRSAPNRPSAKPDSAAPGSAKSPPATQTHINSADGFSMDNPGNTLSFFKNVVVDRPDLKIWCDRLDFALNRVATKGAGTPPAVGNDAAEADPFSAERIKTATAIAGDGGMVVIWRKTEAGDLVAIGRKAVYTASNGTFTITGLPEVLRDMTYHIQSPNEGDTLVLHRNGSARGKGNQELNLNPVRAKDIRQRLFSHVPGPRPPEATPPGTPAAAPRSRLPSTDSLPAVPKPTTPEN